MVERFFRSITVDRLRAGVSTAWTRRPLLLTSTLATKAQNPSSGDGQSQ
jgi:hypothetical protein